MGPRTLLCCAAPVSPCRLAVFHRLYQQAVALRQKMEMRRETVKKTEIESIQQNKTNMSWISSEMMRDRSAGPFDNYGEMLYAESLESLARKRDKVRAPSGQQRRRWGGRVQQQLRGCERLCTYGVQQRIFWVPAPVVVQSVSAS